MSNLLHVLLFTALITFVWTRPFCPDCYYNSFSYSNGCGWGCPQIQQPRWSNFVLVCPASRTAINCGLLPEAQSCTSDDDCGYGQKCCEDGCFKERICKPGFYVVKKVKAESVSTTEHPDMEEVTAT